mgnify:CR=1 FL=1
MYIKLARDIYKKAENDIEASERNVAKTICLGILYGMGPQQCSMRLVLSGYYEDDDGDMMMMMSILTSASPLCFLLFLFIYSLLSISLLLPSLSHYTLL